MEEQKAQEVVQDTLVSNVTFVTGQAFSSIDNAYDFVNAKNAQNRYEAELVDSDEPMP